MFLENGIVYPFSKYWTNPLEKERGCNCIKLFVKINYENWKV